MQKMLFGDVEMLKKRLGAEIIERNWFYAIDNLEDYSKIPSTLIIPEGCERIGDCAFIECENLREVIIPEKCAQRLKYVGGFFIGYAAFEGCKNLIKVEIPESVGHIAGDAFKDCSRATIILRKAKSVEWIGWNAFKGCKNVKEETRN